MVMFIINDKWVDKEVHRDTSHGPSFPAHAIGCVPQGWELQRLGERRQESR